ncbi:MAG: ubiquinol-cytochrome C chaperone [Alphaproteobacteria bacterium]|nr:ubiquinol-cytochrome C chaperone [Alphaproteobacteria bacterium]MCY4229348.1 ubiquinol-cytochrome C chaperone [Alphaproteobacteria bacterium]MCY4320257.1 ubiquinol-cytochrome C chaperone [Alphaproteobacteria bacterium]
MARQGPAVNLGALKRLFFRPPSETAWPLYRAAVEAARRPSVMLALGVPDTLDGRFELMTLHIALLLRRVQRAPALKDLGQGLVDLFVADMDRSLREMGAGDLSVGRKVKQMASAFYGRLDAYSAGLDRGGDLAAAAERNLYGTLEPEPGHVERAAAYIRSVEVALTAQQNDRLAAGEVLFPEAVPC